jgi:GTPase SAR1 family protein
MRAGNESRHMTADSVAKTFRVVLLGADNVGKTGVLSRIAEDVRCKRNRDDWRGL